MSRNLWFFAELTVLLGFLISLVVYAMKRRRKRVTMTLPELLNKLQPLSKVGLEVVAGDLLEPTPDKIDLRSEVRLGRTITWELVGGWEGLKIIEQNAEILVDVAFYLQQWSTEAIEVTEHFRMSAQDIRREVRQLKRSLRHDKADISVPLRLQRIAGSYFLMTRRLIALVAISNSALLPQLRDAL